MLSLEDGNFKDEWGRTVISRGVNFAADMKQPRDGVEDYTNCPCTLEEADEHYARIKASGFNCIRFSYTWDALQPQHPDEYNEAFIAHAIALVRKAIDEYGFYVFMDAHQDIWSRFSGGSGAPMWTLHAAGFDERYFGETHAAISWNPKQKHQIKMQWASNYHRLVCQTMFTSFFGGEEFAPKAKINGTNVGTYLKDKYFSAIQHMMERFDEADLGSKSSGWESSNEPGHGLIGYKHLDEFPKSRVHVKLGTAPTPFQGMSLGQGIAQTVETYKFTGFGSRKVEDEHEIRPKRGTWSTREDLASLDAKYGWERSWKGGCLWESHGVYDATERKSSKPHYFHHAPNEHSSDNLRDQPDDIPEMTVESQDNHVVSEHIGETGDVGGNANDLGETAHSRLDAASLCSVSSGSSHAADSTSNSDSESTRALTKTGIVPIIEPNSHIFIERFYVQHWFEFAALVTAVNADWSHFMQAPVNAAPPNLVKHYADRTDFSRLVYTPHFYDGSTLMSKRWRWSNVDAIGVMREIYSNPSPASRFGDHQIGRSFTEQFSYLKKEGQHRLGHRAPSLMSEIGIPYDMDKKDAYTSGYWDNQIRAMDANASALETAQLSYTSWCYAISNSHELGDNFAGEDSSIFSRDDERPESHGRPENGVRAAEAVIRPGPIAVAGDIVETHFNSRRATYRSCVTPKTMQYDSNGDGSVGKPQTLVFIPKYHFPHVKPSINANVTQGHLELDPDGHTLIWDHGETMGVTQTLIVQGTPRFRDAAYSYVEGIHKAFAGMVKHLGSCFQ